jgi:glycosyltransferase involved in cell wall biosynthesis
MKVSVCMITYNHERFIAQAIESVVTQETDFAYELVVGEDCSTDRTREICVTYQQKYPDRIRLLLHDKNLGMWGKPNFIKTFNACQGEYIAILEGDDYWTSRQKLQRQAHFLDTHPDYAGCFTLTETLVEDISYEGFRSFPPPQLQKDTYTIADLLRGDFVGAGSTMYRRGLLSPLPDWFASATLGDWALLIMSAQHGKLGYIREPMAVYRIHAGGFYSNLPIVEQHSRNIELLKVIEPHLESDYGRLIAANLALRYYHLSAQYLRQRDKRLARHYAIESIKTIVSLSPRAWLANRFILLSSMRTVAKTLIPARP